MKWRCVILDNEDGVATEWNVRTETLKQAYAEAWAQYRELSYRDHKEPPKWTKARMKGWDTLQRIASRA